MLTDDTPGSDASLDGSEQHSGVGRGTPGKGSEPEPEQEGVRLPFISDRRPQSAPGATNSSPAPSRCRPSKVLIRPPKTVQFIERPRNQTRIKGLLLYPTQKTTVSTPARALNIQPAAPDLLFTLA
ncbi:unnamed protein product [Boreogadus saida]